ncbi:MAG: hypothetical protein K8S54_09125 [Spirochaetia bacterium]|nr:hypothetical protein [Spirochaetia bacterium]
MANQASQFETVARDLVNVGIGLYNAAQIRLDQLQKDIVSGYGGLVTRGAADKSELAESLRSKLGQGLTMVSGAQAKLGANGGAATVTGKKAR